MGFPSGSDFPGGSDGIVSVYNVGDPGSSPGEGNGNPLQYYCLENPMDRGAWETTVYGVAKSWTRLSDFTFPFSGSDGNESACSAGDLGSIPGSGRSPGEGMTTHSSILAWRIPWTEKPGELQSMGLQTVRHD